MYIKCPPPLPWLTMSPSANPFPYTWILNIDLRRHWNSESVQPTLNQLWIMSLLSWEPGDPPPNDLRQRCQVCALKCDGVAWQLDPHHIQSMLPTTRRGLCDGTLELDRHVTKLSCQSLKGNCLISQPGAN